MQNPVATTAGSIGTGLAGLGVLGGLGLFGGGGNVENPYGGQANTDYNIGTNNAYGATGAGQDLASTGENALSEYNQFAPQANQATENELNYLETNPYTDTYSQAKLAQSTGGAMQGYAQAKSALASQLGQRGMASPGGTSSLLTGGDAGIDASEAGTLANNQNAIALQAIQNRANNLGLANQVANQHAQQVYQQGTGATDQGGGLMLGAGSLGSNLGNDYLNEGQQQIQDTQQANQAASNSWGGLASLGGQLAGLF